tara:strand:- start:183 stop:1181 length:999 start_codon:yes stop_codon:yes gene_type:complete
MSTMTTTPDLVPRDVLALADTAEQRYHVYPLISGRRNKKKRWIEAPDVDLKSAQRWLLDNLLYRLLPTTYAHGFVRGRSILSNASRHVGRRFVVTTDIRDFFPSITSAQVNDALQPLGLTATTRHAVVRLLTRRGQLPQGAPTSPHMANLVAQRLDLRLSGLARHHGWTYSRYADDLTFSTIARSPHGPSTGAPIVPTTHFTAPNQLLMRIEQIVVDENFRLARNKTHVMSHHHRQTVTGLVVNRRVALPRLKRRVLRAMLHRLKTTGPDSLDPHDLQVAQGHFSLAQFVDPAGYSDACQQLSTLFHLMLRTKEDANSRNSDVPVAGPRQPG